MKNLLKEIFGCLIIIVLIAFFAASGAEATLLDLTIQGSSGITNGAIFQAPASEIVAGTGLIDSFLRIQANGKEESESGYNTDGTVEFDTKDGKSLQLSEIQTNIVNLGGLDYYEFVLDVAETPGNSIITLTDLEFYLDSSNTKTGYPSLGTLVYDFDIGPDGDSAVSIDSSHFAGNGKLDLLMLIPASYFGTDTTKYVYLYSKLGMPDDYVDDGFEEWAHKTVGTFIRPNGGGGDVPEPCTIFLLGLGIIGLIKLSRKTGLV